MMPINTKPMGSLRSRYHLRRLKRAASLRDHGRLDDAEFGAIVCDVAFRIRSDPSPLASHIDGFQVDGMTIALHLRGALTRLGIDLNNANTNTFSFPPEYGPILRAPEAVRVATSRHLDNNGSFMFTWEQDHNELLQRATLKASRFYRSERWLATERDRFPNLMSTGGAVLGFIVSFWVGTCAGRHG